MHHRNHRRPGPSEIGRAFDPAMPLVLERFKLLYP